VITAEYIQEYLKLSAGLDLPLSVTEELVPLVLGQRAALARLDRFDVAIVRPSVVFDPRAPYGA
jgi:hypothetical protein